MNILTDKLKTLIKPTVEALGFELWGINYLAHAGRNILQIFIEGNNGVSVDDCALVSRQIAILLDVEALSSLTRYTLEVSSPGLDRQLFELDHYRRNLHKAVLVKLTEPINGQRNFSGELLDVNDDGLISLNENGQKCQFPINKVHTARLKASFEKA